MQNSRSGAVRQASWVKRMRGESIIAVAARLGRNVALPKGASRGSVYGCPVCNAERRHTKTNDKRGAIGVHRSGAGWRCWQCNATGDAVALVALVLTGNRDIAGAREWCTEWLGDPHRPVRESIPARPPPEYPPTRELEALWSECAPTWAVPEVAEWLESRRIGNAGDLARALPDGIALPTWAWRSHRLVVPLRDVSGVMRSVAFRRCTPGDGPKSMAPRGYGRAGLVFSRGVISSPGRIVICEGEKKWLQWVTRGVHAIGIESGSWGPEHAAAIPSGSTVYLATDPDDAGADYATRIFRSLAARRDICLELRAEHELNGRTVTVRGCQMTTSGSAEANQP